jgi:hypothetical protein
VVRVAVYVLTRASLSDHVSGFDLEMDTTAREDGTGRQLRGITQNE